METLGGAEIICTDKTGTLTQNKMTVKQIWFGGRHYSAGDYLAKISDRKLADILMLANDAEIDGDKEIGDPTETALKRFVLQKYSLQDFQKSKRLAELPFDSERKMMTVINAGKDGAVVHTKGAPDELLKICTHIYDGSTVLPLTEEDAAGVQEPTGNGKQSPAGDRSGLQTAPPGRGAGRETDICRSCRNDRPPRPEAYAAVKKCKDAGITPVMITGTI